MIRLKIFLSVMLIQISGYLCAQLSGNVKDLFGLAIQDVFVQNQSNGEHTHTDENGNFLFKKVNAKDTLKFSMLGYQSNSVLISDVNEKINVALKESNILLNEIDVTVPVHENLQKIDFGIQAVQNSQELLRFVPGLFIAQHAGAGKAEQIFLRGFDVDHGTDINISVDQFLPVNMVSHAHGQGYADLHFVIPECVQNIEFDKGSYNAAKGNFATAGHINFKLKEKIYEPILNIEAGMFDFHRMSAIIPVLRNKKQNAYFAGEYLSSRGYFDHPQNLKKYNSLLKYNYNINNYSGLKAMCSYFSSHWTASGQIPERAVTSGLISRFGAIDSSEGGLTSRLNFLVNFYFSKNIKEIFKFNAFLTDYTFALNSNFTFFLNDPVNGDQILQKEQRRIFGLESSYEKNFGLSSIFIALGSRLDKIDDSQLSHTKYNYELIEKISNGDIMELNTYGYFKYFLEWNLLEVELQGRYDRFDNQYKDLLKTNTFKKADYRFSPKCNIQYSLSEDYLIYFKSGLGFHTNDIRIIAQDSTAQITAASYNTDLGIQLKLFDQNLIHGGLWLINLEDELVYVGDEAIVQSAGKTNRYGIELGWRSQWHEKIYFDSNISYTIARSDQESTKANFIPLAAKWCSSGGMYFKDFKNFSGSLRYRFLGDRPAKEDYSITAVGYTIFDFQINYLYKNVQFGISCENIFNRQWNEAQFATKSKLKNEHQAMEELHFTPGTPLNGKLKIEIKF